MLIFLRFGEGGPLLAEEIVCSYNANALMNNVVIGNEIFGPDIPSPTGYVNAAGNPTNLGDAHYTVDYNIRTGIAGRNTLRGPLFSRLDTSLSRDFGFENVRFQIRVDFFNALNQPNYLLKFDRSDLTYMLFNDAKSQPEDLAGQGGSALSGRIKLRLTF